jgi:LmbE family N-acetylglucosaminyl deacetylase
VPELGCRNGRHRLTGAIEPHRDTEIDQALPVVRPARRALETLLDKLAPADVYTASGIGQHVDHLLTRDAVLAATERRSTTVYLWEDIPYAIWASRDVPYLGTPQVVPLDQRDVDLKWCTVQMYASQQWMLWHREGDGQTALQRYARGVPERFGENHSAAEIFYAVCRSSRT